MVPRYKHFEYLPPARVIGLPSHFLLLKVQRALQNTACCSSLIFSLCSRAPRPLSHYASSAGRTVCQPSPGILQQYFRRHSPTASQAIKTHNMAPSRTLLFATVILALVISSTSTSGGICTGKFCCLASCGKCGGHGCSSRPGGYWGCCTSVIASSGRLCDHYSPPCQIVNGESRRQNNNAGLCSGGFCCYNSCGKCGGHGCGSRPGGYYGCCTSVIASTGRTCDKVGPPCRMASRRSTEPLCDRGLCCNRSCGKCQESGCQNRPGGWLNCCRSGIALSGRRCDNDQAPCLEGRRSRSVPKSLCSGDVCCAPLCGACTESKCNARPGGWENCCPSDIRKRGIRCTSSKPYPCVRG